jgi:alpha-glucoside transport system permease protein
MLADSILAGSTLANSTLSDAMTKSVNTGGAVIGFLAVLAALFAVAGRVRGRWSRRTALAVFLAPALTLLTVGLLIPAIRTIYLSLRSADGTHSVGMRNYVWAFTTDAIRQVLLNTVVWIVVAPVAATALGLGLAVLVDRMRHEALYKALIFLPMAVSFVGASIIWKFVYEYRAPGEPQIGLLSQVLMTLGWKNPPNWLLSHPLNNFLLMVILVWVQTGFAMVVLSAAIKAVPVDIVEAAKLDGARGVRVFVFVTLPMIRNTMIVVLTTVMITTLKVFDIVRTMTGGNFGTQVLANEMYSQSFVQFDTGRGSALAVILFLAVLPLVGYNIVRLRKERALR